MLAKALLGQYLLNKSWHQAKQAVERSIPDSSLSLSDIRIKPWPWADIYPVGQLRFSNHPSTGDAYIVLNNDSGEALAFGPGLHGLSLTDENITIISGHNDSVFSTLEQFNQGDEITFERLGSSVQRYQVHHVEVFDSQKQQLFIDDIENIEQPVLLLVTCFPFSGQSATSNTNGLRYLVYAVASASEQS